jgi:hypothetical protein
MQLFCPSLADVIWEAYVKIIFKNWHQYPPFEPVWFSLQTSHWFPGLFPVLIWTILTKYSERGKIKVVYERISRLPSELTRHKAEHIGTTASGADTAAAQWGCLTKTTDTMLVVSTLTAQTNWTPEYTHGENRTDERHIGLHTSWKILQYCPNFHNHESQYWTNFSDQHSVDCALTSRKAVQI